ncbi:transmembrane protein 135-like [Culicoides brevitarsis]|uniref:transmembrane protein 135-like n=1 Tax=Culicoides brevitarsis TaxID=469753 RepID=UPI00307B176F
MQALSKFTPNVAISATCTEYVHPWINSCPKASIGMCLCAFKDSFRIYCTVYFISLLMRRRIPTLNDLKHTFQGLLRSTWFLTTAAYGFPVFACSLRRLLGHFNVLTVGFLPAFLTSICAIVIERPTRRSLLALYVANCGTEAAWRMLEERNLVKSSKNRLMVLFGVCLSILTFYYKKGFHLNFEKEPVFDAIKFIMGDISVYENARTFPNQTSSIIVDTSQKNRKTLPGPKFFVQYGFLACLIKYYIYMLDKMKQLPIRNKCCPHNYSCVHYCMDGTVKLFGTGVLIQVALKFVFQLRRTLKSPKTIFSKDTIKIGLFLGGFSAIFRTVSCLLRSLSGKDSELYIFPAVLLASTTLKNHPDASIVLYIMWKSLQLTFQIGKSKGYWKSIPLFTEFLYCFFTALLFHSALVEPRTLRLSYWRFLMGLSGGRVAVMNRKPIDGFGYDTSTQLNEILVKTRSKVPDGFFW